MEFKSASTKETLGLGSVLGASLTEGDVVCLEGELGTGKTVLVRGIARGRGYEGPITSPTFTIIRCFEGARLCHVDAFRLSGPADLVGVGIDEFLEGDWVCVVEWADRVRAALPGESLNVRLGFGRDEDARVITIEETAPWSERLRAMEWGR